jgi:hypothetical protein
MTTMHLTDDDLVLHYYGEMTEAGDARACAHLEACARCRENLQKLQRVMAAIDSAPAPEPDAFFEQRTWARLQGQLGHHEEHEEKSWAPAPPDRRWTLPWAAIGWGAAAALIVIAAFLAGRFYPAAPAGPATMTATREAVGERVLLVDLGDHLDRTENALVEFVTGTDGRDIAGSRTRVEDLVAANRLYRRTAVTSGDQAVADVLDELERVLIEIAGTSPEASTDDLDAVRRRIDTRGLLFKVRVMRDELQERAKDSVKRQGQETTL